MCLPSTQSRDCGYLWLGAGIPRYSELCSMYVVELDRTCSVAWIRIDSSSSSYSCCLNDIAEPRRAASEQRYCEADKILQLKLNFNCFINS